MRHQIETSAEVWAVIKARHHKDLTVFGTLSDPDGEYGQCQMYTEYGFKGADVPMMAANTMWEKHPIRRHERVDEVTEYLLFYYDDEEMYA